MKVPKCASSTTSGVARRVASRLGLHGVTSTGWIGGREPGVWASYRAPARGCARGALDAELLHAVRDLRPLPERAYFFRAGRADAAAGAAGDAARKVEALRGCVDFAQRVAAVGRRGVNDTLSFYDRIGVAERFDESVVLPADALGVALEAVLYLSSKNSSAGGVHLHGAARRRAPAASRRRGWRLAAALAAPTPTTPRSGPRRPRARRACASRASRPSSRRSADADARSECGAAARPRTRCYQSDAGAPPKCLTRTSRRSARRGATATARQAT